MKKIYSISTMLILSMLFSFRGNAQSPFPCEFGATALGFANIPTAGIPCQVFITQGTPNARIVVLDDGDTDITIQIPGLDGRVQGNGIGVIGYDCARFSTIKYVRLVNDDNTFCDLILQSNANLPIKLSGFNATLKGGAVQLNWSSIFESNSSHFGIEKSSDGKNFTTIGTVKAAGSSFSTLNYSFVDESFTGTAFYRLKLVDLDGRNEYSKTVYVNGGANASTNFSVFPNPFRSDVQLKGINASDVNKNSIRVFNVTGKQVGFKVTGSNSISIDATLPSGVYFLSVNGQTTKISKL